MAIRRKMIRRLVEELLERKGISEPPVRVDEIAQHCGLKVRAQAVQNSDISGFILRTGKDAIIGVNSQHAAVRQRFTIAHELGHYLIHAQGVNEVHVDRKFGVQFRDSLSSEGIDRDEREANLFAAELLMPKHFIEADLASVDKMDLVGDDVFIEKLARRYGVSSQAMVFRLANLGFIRL